jgi:hypothetical protein
MMASHLWFEVFEESLFFRSPKFIQFLLPSTINLLFSEICPLVISPCTLPNVACCSRLIGACYSLFIQNFLLDLSWILLHHSLWNVSLVLDSLGDKLLVLAIKLLVLATKLRALFLYNCVRIYLMNYWLNENFFCDGCLKDLSNYISFLNISLLRMLLVYNRYVFLFNQSGVLLMNDRLVMLMNVLLINNWLVMLMNDILMMFMQNILLMFNKDIFVMFMDNVLMDLLDNWSILVWFIDSTFLSEKFFSTFVPFLDNSLLLMSDDNGGFVNLLYDSFSSDVVLATRDKLLLLEHGRSLSLSLSSSIISSCMNMNLLLWILRLHILCSGCKTLSSVLS